MTGPNLTGGDLLELGLWIFLRGSVLVLVAVAAARAARTDAATRRLIWAGAVAALLTTPLLTRSLPTTRLTMKIVPASWWDASAGAREAGSAVPLDAMGLPSPVAPTPSVDPASGSRVRLGPDPARRDAAGVDRQNTAGAPQRTASGSPQRNPVGSPPGARSAGGNATAVSWPGVVFLLWAAGALLFLVRPGICLGVLAWATRRAAPVTDSRVLEATRDAARRSGMRRRVRLVVSDDLPAPACWGLRRPVVSLPRDYPDWSDDRLRAVLLHELTHVRRWDYALHLAGEVARALYWPNPLVRWGVARAMAEAETACDAAVLGAGTHRGTYAEVLLTEAREAISRSPRPSFVMPMVEDGRDLHRRLSGVIAFRRASRISIGAILRGASVAAAVVVLLAAFRLGSDREVRLHAALAATRAADPSVRSEGARTLGALEADVAFAGLVRLLDDEDAGVRADAAGALADAVGRRAVPVLLRALGDDDARVRAAVAFALGRTRDRRAFYPLEELTGSGDDSLRLAATWAIGEIKCEPAVARLSVLLRRNADPDTRLAAAHGLRGASADAAAPVLREALADPDPRVRAAAARSLALLT